MKNVTIQYHPGRLNSSADALSRSLNRVDTSDQEEPQVALFITEYSPDISTLFRSDPIDTEPESFGEEQRKGPELSEIIHFIQTEELPQEEKRARKIALQSSLFTVADDTLYYVDSKQKHLKRVAVPTHLKE